MGSFKCSKIGKIVTKRGGGEKKREVRGKNVERTNYHRGWVLATWALNNNSKVKHDYKDQQDRSVKAEIRLS